MSHVKRNAPATNVYVLLIQAVIRLHIIIYLIRARSIMYDYRELNGSCCAENRRGITTDTITR